jgi:hypothetical protein
MGEGKAMSYELYIASGWHGTSKHEFDTLEEVVDELRTWNFRPTWDYVRGRELLHAFTHDANGVHGMVAQVFEDGDVNREITRQLFGLLDKGLD